MSRKRSPTPKPRSKRSAQNQSVGWQFNVTSPVTVTHLAWYDDGADGLVTDHPVGLWSPNGTLLSTTLIPFGTRVRVLEVKKNSVKFQPDGHPPITLVLKYGKDALRMDEYLERIFLREDPHAKLPKPGKDKKQAAAAERTRKLIEEGTVEPGMTKDEVLMALGYPPVHRTPSLSASMWTYWANRWATFEVYFDGDKVSRVQR